MSWTRCAAALLAVATAAVAPAAAHAAPDPTGGQSGPAARSERVTLITGDRVTIAPGGKLAVERAPGRDAIPFAVRTITDHQYVIPADALPLLRAGRIDQRLFDVTALRDFGYTGEADLPLLIAYPKAGDRKGPVSARAATSATARVTRDLTRVGTLAVRAQRTARAGLWTDLTTGTHSARALKPGIERVYLDGKREVGLDVSVPQIGAPTAWQAGLDGAGVTVAVLDSGIDTTHPDLAGRLAAVEDFTGSASADDTVGHGTHVASIIAGSGARSGGRYRGVAPGAKLAIGKVCATRFCDESAILAGMQWAAPIAPVVNLSLSGGDAPGADPLEQAVDDLTAAYDTLFVVAAGNNGGTATVGSPGSADAALTVGAVDDQDQLAGFSSRGPRVGDDAIKPDITAPGVDIVAAGAANGVIGTPAGNGYVSLSGTSMATPHVAGAAAIVAQQHPGFSARQRKTLLMGAAKPTPGAGPFGQGAGRVDVARVIGQAVSVDEGSVSFGRRPWPHDDDLPITRTVTYRNGGAAPVTLSLAPVGGAGAFSVAAGALTVPAGGTATTTVTADTRGDQPSGFLTGRLVATGPGDVKVETPLVVDREAEGYDITFRHVGRDGQPAPDHVTSLFALGAEPASYDGSGTVRVPKGEYGLYSWIFGDGDLTVLAQTRVVVDGPRTIVLDARRGKALRIAVPHADAAPVMVAVNADWIGWPSGPRLTAITSEPGKTFTDQLGPRDEQAGFVGSINAMLARRDPGTGGFEDSPYQYDLTYVRRGAFYTGFDRRVRPAELATMTARYARSAEGASGYKLHFSFTPDGIGGASTPIPFRLPSVRTEYRSTGDAVSWQDQFGEDGLSLTVSPTTRYRAGVTYPKIWNHAVFAPDATSAPVRTGNTVEGGVLLFGDGAGNEGFSAVDRTRIALYSGGDLIGETPEDYATFTVPPGESGYRLEQSATRSAPHRLSTSVDGVWTFRSATSAEPVRLPISTVRFSPPVDPENVAPAGRPFMIPVQVVRGSAQPNRVLTVEFSADDGKTWQAATVTGAGDKRTVRVTNPAGPGYVSLRAHATDTAGNTAVITAIRAYAVG